MARWLDSMEIRAPGYLATIICSLGAILLVAVTIAAISQTNLTSPGFIYVIISMVAIYSIGRININGMTGVLFLFSISAILRFIWVFTVPTQPASDFATILNGAWHLSIGNVDFINQSSYFSAWKYQIGFLSFEAMIISLLGENIIILKSVSVFISSLTVVVIFLMTRMIFGKEAAFFGAMLLSLFPGNVVMTSVLTNQHIATLFFIVSIWLSLTNMRAAFSAIHAGIFSALSNIMRPLAPITLIPIAIVIFYRVGAGKFVKYLAVSLVAFAIVIAVASHTLEAIGVHADYFLNKAPLWKVVVGLNHETGGIYTPEDVDRARPFEPDGFDERAMSIIWERLSDREALLRLVFRKFLYFWGAHDTAFNWASAGVANRDFQYFLGTADELFFVVVLVFASLAATMEARNPNRSALTTALLGFLIFYALVHLVVEVQTRYRQVSIPVICMLAGYGAHVAKSRVSSVLRRGA